MTPAPVPDWMLERYALGELAPEASAAIRARLQAEAEALRAGLTPEGDLSSRLAALQAADAAFLDAHPPRPVAAEVRRRLQQVRAGEALAGAHRRRWIAGALAPVLVAALALFFLLPRDPVQPEDDGQALIETTAKGLEPSLRVYRKHGEAQEQLGQGARALPADLLQLAYVAKGYDHGAILSIDGRGGVTLHLPSEPGGSTALALDGETALGFSYELDDAPGFERFFLVTSEKPIDVPALLEAAARLYADGKAASDPLPLPELLRQVSVRLDKEKR